MIKRMNKVTSLLVAAAAIISIVPASASDYTKIDSQEGTVYNAVAYKDGKFYIDGAVNDKDEAAYYLANGKYNAVADVDTGSSTTTYGTKYINVEDGNSFLNLETGAVTTDSIKENAEDDTASALRKNIKKDTDGRYTTTDAEAIKTIAGNELAGNKFGQVWYGVKYAADNATNNAATDLNVYTDAAGNYIDADYNLGSVKVTTTATGVSEKTVTVSNTDDSYDGAGLSKAVTASVSGQVVIGQDANYIYRTAKVTIKTATGVAVSKIDGLTVATGTTAFDTSVSGEVSFNAIQKISKAQDTDKVDGAKYAKTVNTYVLSDDAGVAANLLTSAKFSIVDGKVIAYTDGASIDAQTIELKSSQGYYYTDVTDADAEDATAFDVDANGNLWRLEGGYVYKFDNTDAWTKVYKVDGAMNKLSVYDQNDMVVWNEADEVYSVIGSKATTPPVDTTTPPVETKKGWVNTAAGWTFFNAAGTQAKGQWVNDGGVWYMIKADGLMATGWYNDNGTWYFLAGSGAMKTGWVQDGSTWYYLQSSGSMKTGWLNDNGTWYYLNASGAMLANTSVDGYKLGASGAWVK